MKPLLLVVFLTLSVHASEDDPCRDSHDQCGHDDTVNVDTGQDQGQDQNQDQNQDQSQGQEMTGGSQSVNLSQSYNSKRVPPIFLYQANQVEACGRVFGFSGANTSGGWAFGIPIPRSWTPTCDLWKAANEAQENGFIWMSYMFQCSIKTVRNTLGDNHCFSIENAAENEMRIAMGFKPLAHIPIPDLGGLYNQAAQYAAQDTSVGTVPTQTYDPNTYYMLDDAGQLVAQVAAEEFEEAVESGREQHELTEERIKEQEEEIERLRREAAKLRRRQEAEAEERSSKQLALYGILERIEQREEDAKKDPK